MSNYKILSSGILNTNTKNIFKENKFFNKNGSMNKRLINILSKLKPAQLNELVKKTNVTLFDITNNYLNYDTQDKVLYDNKNKKFYNKNLFLTRNKIINRLLNRNILYTIGATKNFRDKESKDINNNLKNLIKNNKKFSVDLSRISISEFIKIVKSKYPNERFTLNLPGYGTITISEKNFKDIYKNYDNSKLLNLVGSDVEFVNASTENIIMEVDKVKSSKIKNKGAFFPYINKTNIDLKKYAIYSEVLKENYDHSCLYKALEAGGISKNKLEKFNRVVTQRDFLTKNFNPLCEMLDISIKLTYNKNNTNQTINYGKSKEVYNLGLIEGHFFINDEIKITEFFIKNYKLLKDEKEPETIYRKNGKNWRRKIVYIKAFNVINLMLEENLFETIKLNYEIMNTQFYDKITEYNTLEYLESETKENEVKIGKYEDYYKVFFDFETYPTDEGEHKPFSVCYKTEDGDKKSFVGFDCVRKFLDGLPEKKKILLYAHNAKYDFSFISNEIIMTMSPIIKGNRLMMVKGLYFRNYNKKDFIDIVIKDSMNYLNMALAGFGNCFQLEQGKEIMPYSIYNKESIENKFYSLDLVKTAKEIKSDEDYQQLVNNCQKWGIIKDNKFDIVEYSRRYCEIDCEVLQKGMMIYREWMLKLTKIDIFNLISGASLADNYMKMNDVYNNVYQLSGVPRHFIQKCVVGGRTMTNQNLMYHTKKILADFDGVALYASAMYELGGVLQGKPKVLKNKTMNFLNSVDGYFIKILIKKVGIKRQFPLLSKVNEKGVRIFRNDMEGEIIFVDKITLEDLIEFQKVEFDIIEGYYFDEGRNYKLKGTIKTLFEERLKKKADGNPIQMAYKELMNSSYGKSILKPIETETKVICGKDKYEDFLSRYYNDIKLIKPVINENNEKYNKYIIQLYKPLSEHFNNVHVGTEILSMSKRIMNRVMCLAEDIGVFIFYQDTDSMHLEYEQVEVLAKAYYKKYNKELIGKKMGQFHIDFELKGCDEVKSIESYFLGKKCYIDHLQGKDKKTGEIKQDYHIRLKGIPNSTINYLSNKKYNKNPMKLYEDLSKNKFVKFDLLEEGNRCRFEYTNKFYGVISRTEFERNIEFKGKIIEM